MAINFQGMLIALKINRKVQLGIVIVLVIAIVTVGGYFLFARSQGGEIVVFEKKEPSLGEVARKIDGVLVEKGRENFLPVTVMIENLASVRPQAGLQVANVVYEALAEGGITRFLAIYASGDELSEIGPVRSARPYFLTWAGEYKGIYVHAGGSPQSLAEIKDYAFSDLDQIFGNQNYFWRKKEVPIMEHGLFTSSQLLSFAIRDKKLSENGDFTAWKFKDEAVKSERPSEEKTITIDFSTFNYKVEYKYNAEKNLYLRYNGGVEHQDVLSKEQIHVKNVIIQYVKTSLADSSRLAMETSGEGGVIVFLDGRMLNATWEKQDKDSRTRFQDEDGQEIELNRGNTWIEIVPTDREVTYN